MGFLFNTSAPQRQISPQEANITPQAQSPMSMLGTIADLALTGGMFHAINRRLQANALQRAQAADYAQMGAMFKPGSTTRSPASPLPDPSAGGANLFAGGQYGPVPTEPFGGDNVVVTPPQIPTMEQFAPVAAQAFAKHGTDPTALMALIKGAEPDIQFVNGVAVDRRGTAPGSRIGVNLQNVNNRLVDLQDPSNADATVPQVDKGQVVAYDAQRRPIGVMNLAGNAQAQADVAGAVSGAQEQQKARYDLVDVPLANGSTIKMPRLNAARQLGGGMGTATPAASGFGVSQTPNDKTYGDDVAKAAAARYQAAQTAGQQTPGKIAQYQELGRLFDGFNGNRLSPTGLEMARLGKSMGFNVDPKLGNKEAGVALANQIALTLRDPSNGGGMPGSMSNSDRQFLTAMVPNLAQSDAGRRQLVDIYIAKAGRDQDVAKLARQWQQRYGRIDAPDGNGVTFDDQLQKWSEAHPMFGKH